ncbi:MAG: GAF domain-containing protein, partial [Anaerolineae bacterium]|nr:GAF domain-containing protein [Anaerolineae bacterium]
MPKNKTKAEILIELEQAHKRIAELEAAGGYSTDAGLKENRTEAELRESEKRLRAMMEISQAMSASLDMDVLLQKIVDDAVGLLQLESGAIYTLIDNELYLEATTPPLPLQFPNELRRANVADHPHIQAATLNGSIVVLEDSSSAALSSAEKVVVEARGLRSIAYIPLMISEKAIGVFIVASVNRLRTFSKEELDLYAGFSGQAAQTIENIRLYRSEREYAA